MVTTWGERSPQQTANSKHSKCAHDNAADHHLSVHVCWVCACAVQAVGDLVAAAAAASGHGPSSSSSSPGSSLVPLAVAVTGSKGCGKSAFARLLVNALLTRQQGGSDGVVAYLDLDPGQPEFTPPVSFAAAPASNALAVALGCHRPMLVVACQPANTLAVALGCHRQGLLLASQQHSTTLGCHTHFSAVRL